MVLSLSNVPEFLGAAALQVLTGASQVFILQSCPKGQNWRSGWELLSDVQ